MTPPVGDTGGVAVQTPPKRKRGRETAADMVRSLGIVLVVVVALWFLARPPAGDVQEVREVDPGPDVAAFSAAVPDAAVPGTLPDGWRPTVSRLDREPLQLRVGWNTPSREYAEYAAVRGGDDDAVAALTGGTERLAPVDVGGQTWQQLRDGDGSLSLVREDGDVTVVVGTTRASASLDELRVLAASLR